MSTTTEEKKPDFNMFSLHFNPEDEIEETPAAGAASTEAEAAGTDDTTAAAATQAAAAAEGAGAGTEGAELDDEADVPVRPFAEALFNINGWQWDDQLMETDTIEDFNKLIGNLVQVNKEAALEKAFADPQTKKFNELVAKGASHEQAYNALFNQMDYNKVDLKDQNNQETIVRRYYEATTQFSTERIEKEIKKAADLNELEELATEGIKKLKELEGSKTKDLEAHLEAQKEQRIQDYHTRIENKKTEIRGTKNLAGFEITPEEATAFIDFMFTQNEDLEATPYQDYVRRNPNWEIEAAYTLYKRLGKDTLARRTTTEATKLLKEKVFAKKKSSGNTSQQTNRVVPNPGNPDASNKKQDFNDFLL